MTSSAPIWVRAFCGRSNTRRWRRSRTGRPSATGVGVPLSMLIPTGTFAERRAHDRQAGLVLADGRLALPSKRRVDQRVGPERRRAGGHDAVAPAVELEALPDVADLDDPGEPGPGCGSRCRQDAVLGVEADGDRGRVASRRSRSRRSSSTSRTSSGSRRGCRPSAARSRAAGRPGGPDRPAAARRPRIGEVHHHAEPGLEAGASGSTKTGRVARRSRRRGPPARRSASA